MKIFTASSTLAVLSSLLTLVDPAAAWGVAGHQIVATIAEIHLHPSTRQAVARILPEWTKGHLAPIAAWPDRVRFNLPWSGQLHYVTPNDPEHPPENCGWVDGAVKNERNVLTAIQNYTVRVAMDRDDTDLRFLVHYIGDVHQPLHLTGRERGGNGDSVLFERRHMSLHGLWDTALLTKSIREIHNYTHPLPSRQVENVLTGSIYDPYVRWVVWEGIRKWWRSDLEDWVSCPTTPSLDSITEGAAHQQAVFSPPTSTSISSDLVPNHPPALRDALASAVCPSHWAAPVHSLCCSHVFPPAGSYNFSDPTELNTPQYHGKIADDKVVEHLLAKAGIRLASVLNTILGDAEELRAYGSVRSWEEIEVEEKENKSLRWRW